MNLLDRWALRRVERLSEQQNRNEDRDEPVNIIRRRMPNLIAGSFAGSQAPMAISMADFNRGRSLNFTLHPAVGGHILELSVYDEKTDRHQQRLHLISDDIEMGDAISKILTVELLRR